MNISVFKSLGLNFSFINLSSASFLEIKNFCNLLTPFILELVSAWKENGFGIVKFIKFESLYLFITFL